MSKARDRAGRHTQTHTHPAHHTGPVAVVVWVEPCLGARTEFLGLNLRWDQGEETNTKGADSGTRPGKKEEGPESSQDEKVLNYHPKAPQN